jgi:YHYH protein
MFGPWSNWVIASVMLKRLILAASIVLAVCCAHRSAAMAHDPALERLPLGDGKYASVAQRGVLMSCKQWFWGGIGAHRLGEWIREGYWHPGEKPIVEGQIAWPASSVEIFIDEGVRVVRANNLPRHTTGMFPIDETTRAYAYDRNPNAIQPQSVLLRLPLKPDILPEPECVPMGLVGFTLQGAALFNGLDERGQDAPAHEIQDSCNGHPEVQGRYHYHNWSPCLGDDEGKSGRHSSLAGWIVDGFPIFGPTGENGERLTNQDLDVCHGHIHDVMIDGRLERTYHYHFTAEFPYTVGCLRGRIAKQSN